MADWQTAFLILGGLLVVVGLGVALWLGNTPGCDEVSEEDMQEHIREYMRDHRARRARAMAREERRT